jgi:prepilin-type N-terminal cleavage/methylation domain-containing protein
MLQKLNKKLSRNQKGFSLIELMIAVAILAIVAMGLFQAFTVAFQSMADSKDRTIATNYAQQILEDYKNIHFERIQPFSAPIADSKFYQTISVSTIEDNLKRVIAEISWDDRNNNEKSISAVTKIYNTQGFAEEGSVPTGIVIYANKYNLLPGSDTRSVPAHIYAEIIDNNGNLITDWNESNVSFEIISVIDFEGNPQDITYLGTLSNNSVALDNGIADTYFNQYYEEEREGFVKIKASLTVEDVNLYDELTLKITNEAVAILLETDKEIISTVEGDDDTAHLTAKIVDAANEVVSTDREISFRNLSGLGILTNFIPTSEGLAYIDLVSNSIAGVATITASSDLLEPGTIDIEIANPDLNNIEVEASDQTSVQQGSTSITAMLTDYLGNPVSGETINFAIDNSELGDLSSTSETTDGDGNVSTTLTMNFAGTIVVTASWEAADGTIVSDTVSVLCRNHNLYVTANPLTITEGGSSTITAELTNADGYLVEGEIINFTILEGDGDLSSLSGTTNELGVTSVTLNIEIAGTTTVEANWQGDSTVVLDFAEVICTSAPIYQVTLTADKTTISVGETLDIKATVTENRNPVSGIEVEFSLDDYSNARIDGSDSPVIKTTDGNGEATVVLSNLTAGDSVTVTAEAGGDTDSINISCEVPEIVIELAVPANIHYGANNDYEQVYFDIIVKNGDINLRQMNILWEPVEHNNEDLKNLLINDDLVYSNNSGAESGTTISFNQVASYNLGQNETYVIKMIFKRGVENKDWTITFINPNTGNGITPAVSFDADDFN